MGEYNAIHSAHYMTMHKRIDPSWSIFILLSASETTAFKINNSVLYRCAEEDNNNLDELAKIGKYTIYDYMYMITAHTTVYHHNILDQK